MAEIDRFIGEWAFLSNFNPSPFEASGFPLWPTVEHYFQAMKSRDPEHRMKVYSAETPGQAKQFGRRCNLRPDWEEIKIRVMRVGLLMKFAPKTVLAVRLLNTNDLHLIEGNTWGDRFWGVCDGQGENWLGHLLMARRAELRSWDG